MSRTTPDAVKALLLPGKDYGTEEDPNTGADLTGFIDTASVIVDDIQTAATEQGITITAAKFELLERWLAAWAYKMSDQQEKSKSVDGTSSSFRGQEGKGYEANLYGQTAMKMDPTGVLADTPVPDLEWGGKPFSEQIPYDERD